MYLEDKLWSSKPAIGNIYQAIKNSHIFLPIRHIHEFYINSFTHEAYNKVFARRKESLRTEFGLNINTQLTWTLKLTAVNHNSPSTYRSGTNPAKKLVQSE